MKLLQLYLKRELKELHENRVRLNAIGRLQDLPAAARAELKRSVALTAKNDGLTLTLALNYGGRQDIVDAAKKALALVKRGKLGPAKLDEALFGSLLSTGELPEVDLVIRTSGEMRLSNFLLWQTAYAEVYFTDTLWPDFRQAQLADALHDFARRERRFGDVAPRKS
jgi:undecaprenyl diphosphate synthase